MTEVKRRVEYRIQYNDSPGESWSSWEFYDNYVSEAEMNTALDNLIIRRKGHATVFRACRVTTVIDEVVLMDTLEDSVIQEEP